MWLRSFLLFVFLTTKEAPRADDNDVPPNMSVRSIAHDFASFWRTLTRNTPLARVFGAVVIIAVALSMFSKCVLYWFKYGLQRPDLIYAGLMLPAIMVILCAPFWVWFAKRYSKRHAWMLASCFAGTGYLGFYINSSSVIAINLSLIALIGLGTSGLGIMFWSMLPDTVEYNQWKLGERNEAKAVGFITFAQKSALAINALLLGQLLDWVGYVANQPLSLAALSGIKAMMCLIPFCGVIGAAWVLWKYPISPQFHRQMLREIEARNLNNAGNK